MPPQAAGMSCYSVAEEIIPRSAGYLVVDAVLRNRSRPGKIPVSARIRDFFFARGGWQICPTRKTDELSVP